MKKISTSSSGIFTIKEYEMEEGQDFVSLVKQLCAGPEPVQEIIPYVFEGDDPLGIDANPVSAGDFVKMYPGLKGYGEGLAFDVIVRREEGHPVTVELTEGSRIIAINTLDQDAEIDDLQNLKNNQVLTNISLSSQMTTTSIDLNNENDFLFPLIDIYYYRLNGKYVRCHDRPLGNALSKEKKRILRTFVHMDDFSWSDEKSLMELLKRLQ